METTLFRKKQLLEERNNLLEQIGQDVFEGGSLPDCFAMLPHEFEGMNIHLTELQERYRGLKEERDRTFLSIRDQLNLMTECDKRYEDRLRPLKHDQDELQLKVQYQQINKRKQQNQNEAHQLMDELQSVSKQIDILETGKREEQMRLRTIIEPLEDRMFSLDRTIRKVQDELQALEKGRHTRLRDLGFWYYKRHSKNEIYADSYQKLEHLTEKLAVTTPERRHYELPMESEPPDERANRAWIYLIAVFLLVGIVGYFSRTRFATTEMGPAAFAVNFQDGMRDSRVFADLVQEERALFAAEMPVIENLPGGRAFRDFGQKDLKAFLISRLNTRDRPLVYCLLQFNEELPRFDMRLAQEGWDIQSNTHNMEALSDGTWVWIVLNAQSYLLIQKQLLPAFEALDLNKRETLTALVQKPVMGFDTNHPVLQGYDLVRWTKRPNMERLRLRGPRLPRDFSDRQAYVHYLGLERGEPSLKLSDAAMEISGPGLMNNSELTPSAIRNRLARLTNDLLDNARATILNDMDKQRQEPGAVVDRAPAQVRIFRDGNGGLKPRGTFNLNHQVVDLIYQDREQQLWILDTRARFHRYNFGQGELEEGDTLDLRLDFPESQLVLNDFAPAAVAANLDRSTALLYEDRRKDAPPRIVALDLTNGAFLAALEMPENLAEISAVAWDDQGERLFLAGLFQRSGRQGNLAMVTYTLDGNRLLEGPIKTLRGGEGRVAAMISSGHRDLFLHLTPGGQLMRYSIDEQNTRVVSPTDLGRKSTGVGRDPQGLLVSRSGEELVLLDAPGGQDRAVRLLSHGVRPSLLSTLTLDSAVKGAIRVPLSDRFWAIQPKEEKVVGFRVQDYTLVRDQVRLFGNFTPTHLVPDTWGHHLLIVGREK